MPRKPTTPSEIEIHRLKFHHAGKKGNLVHFDTLSKRDRTLLSAEILKALKSNREADLYEVCLNVFLEWGVMCTHPQEFRTYGDQKSATPRRDFRWYSCGVCKCAVMNPDFDRVNSVSGVYVKLKKH